MSSNWSPTGLYPTPPPYQQYAEQYPEPAPESAYAPTEPTAPYEQQAPAPVREAEAARRAFSWKRAIFSGTVAYLVLHYSFRVVNPNAASISFVVGLFFGFLGDSQRKTRIFVQRLNPFHYLPRTGPSYPTPHRYVHRVQPEVVITPVFVETYPAPQLVRVTTTSTNSVGFDPVSYGSTSFGGSSSTPPPGPTTSNVRSAPARPTPTTSYNSSQATPPPLGRAVRAHQPNNRSPQSTSDSYPY